MRGHVISTPPEFTSDRSGAAVAPPPENAPAANVEAASPPPVVVPEIPEPVVAEPAVSGPVVSETETPAPAAAEPEADGIVEETVFAPRRPAGARWRLTLATGEVHPLVARAVAGRAPRAPEGWQDAALVTIEDPDRTVSKTHAGFSVEGDVVYVTDLASTNGVAIVLSDGSESVPDAGVATAIPEGADVELGSFAIRVERA
jgi:hypothetical protein